MATNETPAVLGVHNVPMKLIVADPKRNSRTTYDPTEIDHLADSMKREGQVQAVRVEKAQDGKYYLVFGYRRHAAATKLGWDQLRAEVIEPMAPTARKIANIAENLAREDLSPYDQALAFLDLQKSDGLSGTKIAGSVGKSTQYTNNLIRIAEGLDDSVLRRWREESQPNFGKDRDGKRIENVRSVCNTEWLGKLVAKVPRANQEYELKVAMGLIDPDAGADNGDADDGDEEGKRGRSDLQTPRRATMKHLEQALKHAEELVGTAKGDELHNVRGIIQALKFAAGKTVQLNGPNRKVIYKPGMGQDKKEEKENGATAKA